MRDTVLGDPNIRSIVLGVYIGPPVFGKLPSAADLIFLSCIHYRAGASSNVEG